MTHLLLLFVTMNFGNILFNHTEENKKIVRNIESLNKKTTNAKLSVLFNQTCISNNLLPSYKHIYGQFQDKSPRHGNHTCSDFALNCCVGLFRTLISIFEFILSSGYGVKRYRSTKIEVKVKHSTTFVIISPR